MLGRGPWSPVSACRCRPVGPRCRGSMASEPRRSQAIEKERNFLRKAASDNSTARVMDQLKTERETYRQTDRDRSSSPYTVHLCLVVRGPGIARLVDEDVPHELLVHALLGRHLHELRCVVLCVDVVADPDELLVRVGLGLGVEVGLGVGLT